MSNIYLEKLAERDHKEGAKKGLERGAKTGAILEGGVGAALGAKANGVKGALARGALGATAGALSYGAIGAGIGGIVGSKKKDADHEKKASERKNTKVYRLEGKGDMPKSVTGKTGLPATQVRAKGRWRTAATIAGGVGATGLAAAAVNKAVSKREHEKKAAASGQLIPAGSKPPSLPAPVKTAKPKLRLGTVGKIAGGIAAAGLAAKALGSKKEQEKRAAFNTGKDAPGGAWKAEGRKEALGRAWNKNEGTRKPGKVTEEAVKMKDAAPKSAGSAPAKQGGKVAGKLAKNVAKGGAIVGLGGLAAAAASKLKEKKKEAA